MKYRIGIDVGTNSLGWTVLELDDTNTPIAVQDLGARIFSDGRHPKTGASNAEERRGPRGMRRNRDRGLQRKRGLLRELTEFGLMPTDDISCKGLERLDPWVLRARAMQETLPLHHVGRALFHLNQRRGFKSNRKTDKAEDTGKVYDAIAKTKEALKEAGVSTLGELFGKPRLEVIAFNKTAPKGKGKPLPQARVRLRGEGAKMAYDYYPTRALILDEFDKIWEHQAPHHPEITEAAHKVLRHRIEYQRPLKPQPVGKCTLIETQARAPKALPSVQHFRIYSEVNNLTIGQTGQKSRVLTQEERDIVSKALLHPTNKTAKKTFDQIRKLLDLPNSMRFNLESVKRKDLVGDETAAAVKDSWGPDWYNLTLAEQDEAIEKLLGVEDPKTMLDWLMGTYGFDAETAQIISNARLKDAHGHLSKLAISQILPHLKKGLTYDKAVSAAGLGQHSQRGAGVIYDEKLPYYGEVLSGHVAFAKPAPANGADTRIVEEKFGKIANPSVHVALNEIGKLINDLMSRYGKPPEQVVMEMARDLPLSARGKRELESRQASNQKDNEARREVLAQHGASDSYENRLRLRLFEELPSLEKKCIYSGETISLASLFSDAFEIDHILPYSRTLDDGFGNKILCTRKANREKGNYSPFEAFGDGAGWEALSIRADALPPNKKWRFGPDAMERYENEERDFLARQLTDTQYIARLAKRYVEAIYGGQGLKDQENRVWVTPGRLTSDLRHYAGLNTVLPGHNSGFKERTDHRHHAVDAVVIAFTDRGMVKRAADQAKREDMYGHSDMMKIMAEPLQKHRNDIEEKLKSIIISHKPDHGYQAAMHNDTAYGVTGERDDKNQMLLVTRKPIDSFEKAKQLEDIRDYPTRIKFLEAVQGLTGKEFKDALKSCAGNMTPPVRRVRVLAPMKESSFLTIGHGGNPTAKAYKGDGNYCYDIWSEIKKDKPVWTGQVITTYQAYQKARHDKNWWRKPVGLDGQKLSMRLRSGDMLELDHNDVRMIVRVCKISPGVIAMAEHFESNVDARTRSGYKGEKPLKYIFKAPSSLQKSKAVLISVSPSGKVRRQKRR